FCLLVMRNDAPQRALPATGVPDARRCPRSPVPAPAANAFPWQAGLKTHADVLVAHPATARITQNCRRHRPRPALRTGPFSGTIRRGKEEARMLTSRIVAVLVAAGTGAFAPAAAQSVTEAWRTAGFAAPESVSYDPGTNAL